MDNYGFRPLVLIYLLCVVFYFVSSFSLIDSATHYLCVAGPVSVQLGTHFNLLSSICQYCVVHMQGGGGGCIILISGC